MPEWHNLVVRTPPRCHISEDHIMCPDAPQNASRYFKMISFYPIHQILPLVPHFATRNNSNFS